MIINVDAKIKTAVQVFGSIVNHENEFVHGKFDEEVLCLIYLNKFSKNPIYIADLDSCKSELDQLKEKITIKISEKENFNKELLKEKVKENFRFMNSRISNYTTKELAKNMKVSISAVRKAKREGYFDKMIMELSPDIVPFDIYKNFAEKVHSLRKNGFDFNHYLSLNEYNYNSFYIFIDNVSKDIEWRTNKSIISTDKLSFNLFYDKIMKA
jgi:hypothetical protein